MNSRHGEPRLEDMLADSIVKALMEADGVNPRELEAELRQTSALLRATRRTASLSMSDTENLRFSGGSPGSSRRIPPRTSTVKVRRLKHH
jgi:hypothetical protein